MEGSSLPVLSATELRVLGSLIEKSRTTPDYYPMTLNALTAACSQKSSRNPVIEYNEQEIQQAVNSLKGQSLVSTAVGGGSRVIKYKHNFATVFDVTDEELAVLCLLFLRGPQTAGEINNNAGRLFAFRDLTHVLQTLDNLASAEQPFVREITKAPGQKEIRFMHLLGDVAATVPVLPGDDVETTPDLRERVEKLEKELAELKDLVQGMLDQQTG